MTMIHRQDFILNCDNMFTSQGEWLADIVSQRQPLEIGTTVQVGWSSLKLLDIGGKLTLCEPDFTKNPFVDYCPDVTTTLKVLLAQNEMVSKFQCECETARFDDKVILRKGCINNEVLVAQRQAPTHGDSGWYISAIGDPEQANPENLEAIWLFQLLIMRPCLLSIMSLPTNWLVTWQGDQITSVINETNDYVWRQ